MSTISFDSFGRRYLDQHRAQVVSPSPTQATSMGPPPKRSATTTAFVDVGADACDVDGAGNVVGHDDGGGGGCGVRVGFEGLLRPPQILATIPGVHDQDSGATNLSDLDTGASGDDGCST
mmetsp:Transcript_72096/g.182287  ORF Transcript_72096/g.182287 Transcript_72096/m.182287 type:complete len:120 (+) Transcript_72096:247-606(+)